MPIWSQRSRMPDATISCIAPILWFMVVGKTAAAVRLAHRLVDLNGCLKPVFSLDCRLEGLAKSCALPLGVVWTFICFSRLVPAGSNWSMCQGRLHQNSFVQHRKTLMHQITIHARSLPHFPFHFSSLSGVLSATFSVYRFWEWALVKRAGVLRHLPQSFLPFQTFVNKKRSFPLSHPHPPSLRAPKYFNYRVAWGVTSISGDHHR